MYLIYILRIKDQGETKDEPRMNLRTPYHQNVLFIKIAVLFPSLIPCLILPTDDRENTERRAHQLPVTQKCCFLRLLPNQVVPLPKKVDSIPEIVDSSVSKQKSPKNHSFLAYLKKKVYLCAAIVQ